MDIWTVSELDLYLKNHSLPWKKKLKKEKLEVKETRAEALRTMTVTGQRLLQEPEAVSDDDDDEGDDAVLGETRSEENENEEIECEESENEESESEEGDESEFEPLAKIIRASNSIFSFPFFFRKKMVGPPYARCNFRWKFSTAPPKSL